VRGEPIRSTLLAVAVAALLVAVPRPARADDIEEAKRHFKVGVEYLQDQEGARYEEAYREFKRAYDLSHSPKVLGNLGLCAMKLERDGEAIDAYSRYLREVSDIDADEKAQITRDLQTLTTSSIAVALTSNVKNALIVDTRVPVRGADVSNSYELGRGKLLLRLRAGHHIMHLRVEGRDRAEWEFNSEAGASLTHAFDVHLDPVLTVKPALAPRSSRAAPIAIMTIGAVGLAAGGVFGIVTLGKLDELKKECPDNKCPKADYPADVDAVRPFVQATDFLLLGGAIVTTAGFVWLVASGSPSPPKSTARLGGACNSTGCFASLGGEFQ
jgi:hypothetical protein